jgi:NadR type nicotinamide-nucleotide adenylyltransferase
LSLKKIVVIGPESTGKSWLCEKLASHYNTNWVKEYAREYLLTNGKDYTLNDLDLIAKGQIESVNRLGAIIQNNFETADANKPLFIDTDLYVMKVWSEFVFNQCSFDILNGIVHQKYDLYLLCKPDIPWVSDELREYPDLITREKLFHHYKDIMINQSVPWIEIKGSFENRFQLAADTVNELLQK